MKVVFHLTSITPLLSIQLNVEKNVETSKLSIKDKREGELIRLITSVYIEPEKQKGSSMDFIIMGL